MSGPGHDGHPHFNGMCMDNEPPICGVEFAYTEEGQREIQRCDLYDGHDGPHRNELTGVTEGENWHS